MHVDTLIKGEKFVSRAVFSPDATQLLLDASGEAFDGIGIKDQRRTDIEYERRAIIPIQYSR